jgi:hypothetical protein
MGLKCPFFEVLIMGNVEDKRRILKEIDNDFDIEFYPEKMAFEITHKGHYFMSVPFGEFTRDTVNHVRKMKWLNENGSVTDEIDKHNAKLEESKEKEIEDMAYWMAKDMRKPLVKEIYGY